MMNDPRSAAYLIGVLIGTVVWAIGVLLQIWIMPFASPSDVSRFWIMYGLGFLGMAFARYLWNRRKK